jgi:excisionase family DNA binding protein
MSAQAVTAKGHEVRSLITSNLTLGEPRHSLPPLLLDAHEAARALRLSERTLWARTKAGEIPHVRIGRRVLYSPAALERWLAGLRIGPGAAAKKSPESS